MTVCLADRERPQPPAMVVWPTPESERVEYRGRSVRQVWLDNPVVRLVVDALIERGWYETCCGLSLTEHEVTVWRYVKVGGSCVVYFTGDHGTYLDPLRIHGTFPLLEFVSPPDVAEVPR